MAIIGIDLGTTNTVASVVDGRIVNVLVQPNGEKMLPSLVAFNKNTNEMLVGRPVENVLVDKNWTVVRSVKSSMGKKIITDKFTGESMKVKGQDGSFLRPEEVSAIILKTIKENAETVLGEKVEEAVITVPAHFTDKERTSTIAAGKIAGLKVKRIINEPTAALLEFGFKNLETKVGNTLVYDFGGGTLDISIISNVKDETTYEVLATKGDDRLGGDDIDKLLFKHFKQRFYDENEDVVEVFEFDKRLLIEVCNAKRALSFQDEIFINLPMIGMGINGPINVKMKFTVDEFEEIISDLIDKTINIMMQAVEDSGLRPDEIDDVVLVGGSTRIPLVKERVSKALRRQVNLTINPDESVSKGAAIQASHINGELKEMLLLDVTPHDIGIELEDGSFNTLINRNTTIPTMVRRTYVNSGTTPIIEIPIVQGDSSLPAASNNMIGNINLDVQGNDGNNIDVEVEFSIDIDGVLTVKAKDVETDESRTITITSDISMNKDQINNSKRNISNSFVKLYN